MSFQKHKLTDSCSGILESGFRVANKLNADLHSWSFKKSSRAGWDDKATLVVSLLCNLLVFHSSIKVASEPLSLSLSLSLTFSRSLSSSLRWLHSLLVLSAAVLFNLKSEPHQARNLWYRPFCLLNGWETEFTDRSVDIFSHNYTIYVNMAQNMRFVKNFRKTKIAKWHFPHSRYIFHQWRWIFWSWGRKAQILTPTQSSSTNYE